MDVEDDYVFFFEEKWKTREDQDNHLRSDHFNVLNGAMRLLSVDTAFRLNTISSTAGLEAIKAALV